MTQTRPISASRIPTFNSVQEEAEFWDIHSTTEFEDEWEAIKLDVSPSLEHVLSVRVDRETFRRLSAAARVRGVGASTLARMWVFERLGAETGGIGSRSNSSPGP